jgi:PAS domain S-box-containing protein
VNWVTSRSLLPFFRLVENAREPIAVHHGGNFVYVNPALCSLLGYPGAPDLLGRRFLELVHPDDRAVAQSSAERAIAGEAVPVQEIRVLRRDGGTVSIEALAQRVEFGEGPAVLLLGRDVTQRKEMERQLARSDRLASLGTLAAGVAHEINNPLAFILGNLEFAREELPALARSQAGARPEPLLAEVLEALREAADGAKRVSRIVRDLGVFARGEDEKREPVDVHKTLEAAIAIATNEIRHRARLVKTLEPVPRVIADEARLTQVFLNLLVNAAQAIGEGRAEDNEIRVATRVDASERIVVEVADTGEGIPAAILPRIFDPFFTTKPVNLGTGLGLSICHGIVSALGGEITVESELGHGTTFRVLLPPAPAAGTAPSPPADLVPPGGPRARVLIVDDEPAVLSALRRTLGRDHDVVAAASPEALEILLSDDRFDLVLCDLMMPELSGMALYERVRRSRPELAERFVFMTGGAFTTGAREFLDRVRLRTLHKPFAPGEIARLVAERARAGEARRGTGA